MFKNLHSSTAECQDHCGADTHNHNEGKCHCDTCKKVEQQATCKDDCCCGEKSSSEEGGNSDDEPASSGKKIVYNVSGMDCGSCAMTIQKGVASLPEVKQVNVNFSTGKLVVYAENLNALKQEIPKKVKQLGYSAVLENEKVESSGKEWQITLISTVFFLLAHGLRLTTDVHLLTNALFVIVMLISGWKTLKSAFYSLKTFSLDMNVLMSTACIGAILLNEWSEGATILYLFYIGTFLQGKAIHRTRNTIQQLMNLSPDTALVQKNGAWQEMPLDEIPINSRLLVRVGDRISLDGKIVLGSSSINQAAITGESVPIVKNAGDKVFAGSLNESAPIEMIVEKTQSESTIAKIIQMVEEAEERKAPSETFIEKFASIYTPVVFVLAILTIVTPPLLLNASWHEWVFKGLELLIVACPCALVISTPVSVVAALGNAAKNGVLVKGGSFLEKASKVNTVAFDKTGTITHGKPSVHQFSVVSGADVQEILSIALSIEALSTHPIAQSIVRYAKEKEAKELFVAEQKALVGRGLLGKIEGEEYFIGNHQLFVEKGIKVPPEIVERENRGSTVVIIGDTSTILGFFEIKDTIRSSSVATIQALKNQEIKDLYLLTGDNENVAKILGEQAQIPNVVANMLPENKAEVIEELDRAGKTVAMVGDGINDAPALALADVGIAMGGVGTDVAMDVADIVLMSDNIEKLPFIFTLSKRMVRIIKQNIFFSLSIKLVVLAFIFTGMLPMWLAVMSDTGMSIVVTLNALRLVRGRK
ncbi:Cd2+/Zn2+-exporting ATPase [Pilibacter termitis]|uniref:Cd(2+)-exporting ATPase n=1 Tax=Pilibacter termitis TaxID=263852 RepID=A0A1T4L9H1_9ENTE|nr:cation-translocating P-type ATPase [Pilibacter termitis]SJZ51346.1 Cd2+/Zn2+-exporting ATPase [Pilibacter termitis]